MLAFACGSAGDVPASDVAEVSYSRDVQPIWDGYCVDCHVSRGRPFDPRPEHSHHFLTTESRLCRGFVTRAFVVPGRPEESLLVEVLGDAAEGCMRGMPPSFDELGPTPFAPGGLRAIDEAAYDRATRWIREGARND